VYQIGNSVYDDAGKRLVGNMGFGWNQMEMTLDRWQKKQEMKPQFLN